MNPASVTEWVYVEGFEAWKNSNLKAYRIHKANDGRREWFQHEFWYKDGRKFLDKWIAA